MRDLQHQSWNLFRRVRREELRGQPPLRNLFHKNSLTLRFRIQRSYLPFCLITVTHSIMSDSRTLYGITTGKLLHNRWDIPSNSSSVRSEGGMINHLMMDVKRCLSSWLPCYTLLARLCLESTHAPRVDLHGIACAVQIHLRVASYVFIGFSCVAK